MQYWGLESGRVVNNILMAIVSLRKRKKKSRKQYPEKAHMLSMAGIDNWYVEEMEEKGGKTVIFFQNAPPDSKTL